MPLKKTGECLSSRVRPLVSVTILPLRSSSSVPAVHTCLCAFSEDASTEDLDFQMFGRLIFNLIE